MRRRGGKALGRGRKFMLEDVAVEAALVVYSRHRRVGVEGGNVEVPLGNHFGGEKGRGIRLCWNKALSKTEGTADRRKAEGQRREADDSGF